MQRPDPNTELEHLARGEVCVGLDEVGRGCIAGPVVAAAVILPAQVLRDPEAQEWSRLIDDSKRVAPRVRELVAQAIRASARVGVAWVAADEIDRSDILRASLAAMRRALDPIAGQAAVGLVDGHIDPFAPRFGAEPGDGRRLGIRLVKTIVGGDQRVLSIAAASIVAKVFRDRWMIELDGQYPGYGFASHKGYLTRLHHEALARLGPSPIHRMSFAPLTAARGP